MRTAAKVDVNQAEIVQALRDLGASVQPLHQLGHGVPDLLVGFRGHNWLLEVKSGRSAKLTKPEANWHDDWRGNVFIVRSVSEATMMVAGYTSPADVPPF